ncbi:MAG: hypothetical protein JW808_07460 [Victivallales bacterium]|nr:hypothetical protein [Victivallales bacterium]
METGSYDKGIIKAGMAVFLAHLVFKAVGFVQFFVVGGLTETVQWECLYGFAFDGVIFSLFLVGEEMIGPAFLPLFVEEKEKKSEQTAWSLANTLLSCQMLLLFLVMSLLMVFPEELAGIVTYFDSDTKSDNFDLAVKGVRAMAPALLCFSLGSTTYMLLNGYKKFFLAAFGDAVWKAFVLVSVVAGVYVFDAGWKALVVGIVVGSVLKLLTHLIGLGGRLRHLKLSFDLRNPAFRTMLWLMLPLLLGVLFAKCRDFYNNITVLSSLEADGLIKANAYGRKLFQAIGMIVPYALSIAMFPFFCDLVSRGDKDKLGEIITRSGRMLLSVFVPLAIFCVVLSPELVKLLVIGQFSAEDARLAGISMACYTLVLPAYGLEMFLMQAFFAKKKIYLAIFAGIVFSALSVAISYVGVIQLDVGGEAALMTVSLGYVVSRYLKTAALLLILKRSVPMFQVLDTCAFLVRLCIVGVLCAASAGVVFAALDTLPSFAVGRLWLVFRVGFGTVAGMGAFFAGIWALRIEEVGEMRDWTLRKLASGLRKRL